jgi:ribosome biogenesis SPOUT family RNA methylase Rps3
VKGERDPTGWSTVLVTVLDSWGKHKEGDPEEYSTVLVPALGSVLGKLIPHGHTCKLT